MCERDKDKQNGKIINLMKYLTEKIDGRVEVHLTTYN